jgi:hypothetical protein
MAPFGKFLTILASEQLPSYQPGPFIFRFQNQVGGYMSMVAITLVAPMFLVRSFDQSVFMSLWITIPSISESLGGIPPGAHLLRSSINRKSPVLISIRPKKNRSVIDYNIVRVAIQLISAITS